MVYGFSNTIHVYDEHGGKISRFFKTDIKIETDVACEDYGKDIIAEANATCTRIVNDIGNERKVGQYGKE